MNNYIVKSPMRYYQGYDIISNLRDYTSYLGSSCLVVSSKNGLIRYESLIYKYLTVRGCDVTYCDYESCKIIKSTDRDFIIGIGGGTVIDEVKRLSNDSDCPCVIIPTVLSSDAACNSIIVPKKYDDRDTMIIRANRSPEIVIADTKILIDSPIEYAASGIGDALATYYEAYSSSITTGYTMTHSTVAPSMIARANNLIDELLSITIGAFNSMKTHSVGNKFEKLVYYILYESSVLSENCGIGIAHAFSLAYDEVFPSNKISHGAKVSFGLLLHLTILNHEDFNTIKNLIKYIGLYNDLDTLDINANSLMEISNSISSNKLSKNVTGNSYEPIDIYNYLIKTNTNVKG